MRECVLCRLNQAFEGFGPLFMLTPTTNHAIVLLLKRTTQRKPDMKQFTTLIATKEFGLKLACARGRAAHVKIGDRFMVTSSEVSNRSGMATVDREKKAKLSCGYPLTIETILEYFEIAA
jgi:hypothetical protein